MKIAVLSIFYNTNELFYPLFSSFQKQSNITSYDFYIYDNSDKSEKRIKDPNIDNLYVKYINPKSLISDIPYYNGSAKHAKSVEIALSEIKDKYEICILLDSDIIITGDISNYLEEFISGYYTICGYHDKTTNRNLIHPCAMIINLKDYVNYSLHFYDRNRMYGINKNTSYDTGMSFYEDIVKKGLKVLEIPYNSYFNHFGAGSRDYKNAGKVQIGKIYRDISEWLTDYSHFYN